MKIIKVKLTLTEGMLGTSPNNEDIYTEYIGSKAPDATTLEQEVEAIGADGVIEKGMTVFPRDEDGNPFVYDYQIKGFFKDSCGALSRLTGKDPETGKKAKAVNESGKMTISLTASEATIGKDTVRIMAFNDISSEIAENEQESWSKLIRVLTHEIMNTITPIASLSDTLLDFGDINEEIKNGLSTISESSKGLIKFVDSYRNLTRVAPPVKKAFYFRELVERLRGVRK